MNIPPGVRYVVRMIFVLVVAVAPISAFAVYPDKPITLIVPFSAGGPTDALARVITEFLSRDLGKNVLVDNRGGAGGRLATEAAAAAPADGYTVFFATTGTMAINPALYQTMTLDTVKAFDAVGAIASSWNVLVVLPSFPANTLKELVALAKEKPGTLTFGSAGNGSTNHLSGELLKITAGVDIRHVPYKGSAGAIVDLLGGRLSMMFDTIPTQVQNVQTGRVKALAQTGPIRSTALPNIPTMVEAGIPGFDVTTFFGVVTPKGTPSEVRERLHKAILQILAQDEVKQKLIALGALPIPGSQQDFEKLIQAEKAKWSKLVKESGASVD
jgi:tripartite-type tricarboxylate transporter receptor subunit TctC